MLVRRGWAIGIARADIPRVKSVDSSGEHPPGYPTARVEQSPHVAHGPHALPGVAAPQFKGSAGQTEGRNELIVGAHRGAEGDRVGVAAKGPLVRARG